MLWCLCAIACGQASSAHPRVRRSPIDARRNEDTGLRAGQPLEVPGVAATSQQARVTKATTDAWWASGRPASSRRATLNFGTKVSDAGTSEAGGIETTDPACGAIFGSTQRYQQSDGSALTQAQQTAEALQGGANGRSGIVHAKLQNAVSEALPGLSVIARNRYSARIGSLPASAPYRGPWRRRKL
jgi:hypothetical protein